MAIAPPPPPPLPPGAISPPTPPDHEAVATSITVTLAALGAAALVTGLRLVLPAGRRRGWRPGRTTVPGD